MKTNKCLKARFAVCIDNAEYPASLELHKLYRVIPDDDAKKDGDLRIIDESGEDYIYPNDYFLLVDVPRATAQSLNKSFAPTRRRPATLRSRAAAQLRR
jgi:hypothetical protein